MDLRAMECAATEAVWLRLVRGDSREPVRMLPADLADGVVSVGAADSCDWQIDAQGVPPLAFFLKAIAGSVFVRAAGPAELRVDGHGVGSIWVPVERGARLAIGAAQIEVGLAGRSRRAQHALFERAFDGPVELGAGLPDTRPDAGPDMAPAAELRAGAARDQAAAQVEPSAREVHASPYARLEDAYTAHEASALQWRAPASTAAEQHWSATIFGADDAEDAADAGEYGELPVHRWGRTGLWIAGSLVACAYGCWVLLLDYF